ncbi:MAG: MCE family protein [Alphaproteobacteria bacterium]|nr:MCE family protein [Alphaproteobacteria bacterium]
MADSRRYEFSVGALLVAAALLLAFMAVKVGAVKDIGDNVRVTAIFDDVSGLKDGAAVAVAGVEVGRVSSLKVDFDKAQIGLIVSRSADVREDVIVRLRARSVLGEKFIELVPQSPDAPPLEDGAILTRTEGQVEIDQLVTEMGPLIGAINPEQVNSLLTALIDTLNEDPERAGRMLDDLETLLHNAAVASEGAPDLVSEARATLSDTRSTLTEFRTLARDGKPVVQRAEAVLINLEAASEDLPGIVDAIPPVIDKVDATVTDAQGVVMVLSGNAERIDHILENVEEIDKWELRRLLREEGIKVRLTSAEVVEIED